jgi:aspartate/methionine/tyrosine aminotransferase
VTSYVINSGEDDFASVREVLDCNRMRACAHLDGGLLSYCEPMVKTSVAWFRINDPWITSDALHAHLLRRHIYVLPGKYFFWHRPQQGQSFVRIALAREPKIFLQAMQAMQGALESVA